MYFSKYHVDKKKISRKIIANKKRKKNKFRVIYILLYIILLLGCFYYTYRFRGQLGRGYIDESNMTGGKGTFISISLMLYLISFHVSPPGKKVFSIYTLIYFIFALLIMTMGGRIYFISTLLGIFIFYANYRKQIKIKSFIIFLCIIAVFFSVVGVLRQGSSITAQMIFYIFLAEPIYTSYSLFTCLSMNTLPIINFPYEIVFGFINLIPSFIFPGKVTLLNSFSTLSNVKFATPLGAECLFTSLMVNFGILGIPIFMFVISIFLRLLKKTKRELYYFANSWFVFTFFRDPFFISVWKILFEIAFLIPCFIYINNNLVRISVNEKRKC